MLDLSTQIEQALQQYGNEVKEKVKTAVKEQAKETAKELKKTSPKRAKGSKARPMKSGGKHKAGDYAKEWKAKEEINLLNSTSSIVHNRKHYRLTHLLEFGHAIRNGTGRARAYPHIAKVEQNTIKNFEKKVREKIESI